MKYWQMTKRLSMFEDVKIRCSSIGEIMTNPKNGVVGLSKTCKNELVKIYVESTYGRSSFIMNKYIQKGLQCEDDSITLLSRLHKRFYVKNEEKFQNQYITGTPDIIYMDGETKVVRDIKTSWDIFTFFGNDPNPSKLEKDYFWQVQGYMALTGAQKAFVDFCLVNTPQPLIDKEKYHLERTIGVDNHEVLNEAFEKMERLAKYDDIPMEKRLISIEVPRCENSIKSIYSRIAECRAAMDERFGENKTSNISQNIKQEPSEIPIFRMPLTQRKIEIIHEILQVNKVAKF